MKKEEQAKLALEGGPKAFPGMTGKNEPKLGVEEFLSVAERFGFKPEALERIKNAVSNGDLPEGGPNLAWYYSALPKPAATDRYMALARETFGVPYAYPVSSGTGALHAAFIAVGVGPGTEVICPAMGFLATSMAVCLAGGVPVFVDVDESLQLDPLKIEAKITSRTVALAPTHHWGNVADMDPILAIARKHNLKVVEDCAQGPGAQYKGRYVGTIGDVGCYSISAYKIIGGGESGLIVTRDERLYDRCRQVCEGGGLWRPTRCAVPRYEGELFPGTNYRISELESAINLVQLRKMTTYCADFRKASRAIRSRLKRFKEIRPQKINDADGYIGYMLRFFPDTPELGVKIAAALRAEGIGAGCRGRNMAPDFHLSRDMFPVTLRVGSIPGGSVFDDPRNQVNGQSRQYDPLENPVSIELYEKEVSVGVNQYFTDADCALVAAALNKVLSALCTEDPKGAPWI
jgi:dTDP-4-amino-4,6-dideoxygalactose transaminase